MERGTPSAKEASGDAHAPCLVESRYESIADSVVTEAALSELKRQAPAGCVLCSLDAWDAEEWD